MITSALVALGLVSAASAATTNYVYITGSTAFRGNVFNVLSVAGNGVFDASPAVNILPAGAGSGSGNIVYQGNIGGQPYSIDCSWTGSEAGIAATDGLTVLPDDNTGNNLPGIPALYVDPNTGAGPAAAISTFNGGAHNNTPDLTFADTSQAVSLTKPPTHSALKPYPSSTGGSVGIVTFTWLKGACSSANRDSSWNDLTNITQAQLLYQLPGSQAASFLTGQSGDTDSLVLVGRNIGSGTHVNTFADALFYGIGTPADQFAWNSTYVNGTLTYDAANTAPFFPTIDPNSASFMDVGDDGYDSGAGVSDVLSCDANSANTGIVTIGYAGISDAKHARDGQNLKDGSALTNQPAGAVWLTLDGVSFNDGNVIEGTYSYWGHEHLYGQNGQSDSSPGGVVGNLLPSAITAHGGLGTGSNPAAQDTGLTLGAMKADKPSGGDTGYPSQN